MQKGLGLRPREVVRKILKKCLMSQWLCYAKVRRFKEKVSLGCKKRSGGSTGYQRCDSSDVLLLEDNSDEHYTAKCWRD